MQRLTIAASTRIVGALAYVCDCRYVTVFCVASGSPRDFYCLFSFVGWTELYKGLDSDYLPHAYTVTYATS